MWSKCQFSLQHWKRNNPMMRSTRKPHLTPNRERQKHISHLSLRLTHGPLAFSPSLAPPLFGARHPICHVTLLSTFITWWPECKCVYYSVIKEEEKELCSERGFWVWICIIYILGNILLFIVSFTSLNDIPSCLFQPEVHTNSPPSRLYKDF